MTASAEKPSASALRQMPGRADTDVVLTTQSKTLVYLIHGVTGTPVEMKYVAAGLARRGWNVYGTTLPGHCTELRDLVATRRRDWINHVHRQLSFARERFDRVFVAGLSIGGLLGLESAGVLPVDGLAVLSPTFVYDGWNTPWTIVFLSWGMRFIPDSLQHLFFHIDGPPYGIKDRFLRAQIREAYNPRAMLREWIKTWWPRRKRPSIAPGKPSAASMGYPLIPLRTFTEIDRLITQVRESLGRVKCPTLILQAREDDVTSPRNAQIVFDGICSPVKELVLLDDCYHVIAVDKQKKAVVDHMVRFFQTCEGDSLR